MSPTSPPPEALPSAEQQVQDMQALLEITRALAGTLHLDDLLKLILGALQKTLKAERATLFLYDAPRHELYKYSNEGEPIRFSADRGIAGAAATGRQTINIPDAYADVRFNRDIDRQTGYRTRCLVTVPLIGLDDQLVGVVQGVNKVDGVFTPYDQQLTEAFAAQVAVAIQRAQLLEHYVHKKQLENALAIARDIQKGLLPRSPPCVPGYDVAGWSQPADETGGDCFDYTALAGGRLALTVADVTGHGIGPALVAAEARALLRAITDHEADASAVLARANHWLCADLPESRFVTVFFGILDPVSHRLDFASAGHGPLLWYNAGRGEVTSTSATGPPVGLMDPMEFPAGEPVTFAPGDMGVFLTDGFLEAQDRAGTQFGEKRMRELIVRQAERSSAELIQEMKRAVEEHSDGQRQLDDFTAVVVKRCR